MTDDQLVAAERIHAAALEVDGCASQRQRMLLESDATAWADALKWLIARSEREVASYNLQLRQVRGRARALTRRGSWTLEERRAYRLLSEGIERLEASRLNALDSRERYADRLRTLRTAGRCA